MRSTAVSPTANPVGGYPRRPLVEAIHSRARSSRPTGAAWREPDLCRAALTVVPVAGAEGAGVAALPTAPANSAGAAIPPLFGPVVLPADPVRVKLHIRRAQLNVLDGSAASVTGALRPGLVKRAVELQRLGRHGWETISHTLTTACRPFRVALPPASPAQRAGASQVRR